MGLAPFPTGRTSMRCVPSAFALAASPRSPGASRGFGYFFPVSSLRGPAPRRRPARAASGCTCSAATSRSRSRVQRRASRRGRPASTRRMRLATLLRPSPARSPSRRPRPRPARARSPYSFQRSTSLSSRLANSSTNWSARALRRPGKYGRVGAVEARAAEAVAEADVKAELGLHAVGGQVEEPRHLLAGDVAARRLVELDAVGAGRDQRLAAPR